jgi:hypothetical protein
MSIFVLVEGRGNRLEEEEREVSKIRFGWEWDLTCVCRLGRGSVCYSPSLFVNMNLLQTIQFDIRVGTFKSY